MHLLLGLPKHHEMQNSTKQEEKQNPEFKVDAETNTEWKTVCIQEGSYEKWKHLGNKNSWNQSRIVRQRMENKYKAQQTTVYKKQRNKKALQTLY